jgi:hypothetical protein
LITRRPSAASISRSVAFSTTPVDPTARRSSSTRNAGTSIVSRPAYVFQPTTPTRLPDPMPSSPRMSASGDEASRGWLGRLRSWNRTARTGSGAASASPKHSLPASNAGSPLAETASTASSKRGSKPVR